MFDDKINKLEDGKQKELLKVLNAGAKPYMRKCDGYAVKVSEDTEIKWKDGEHETSIKIPAGDYVKVSVDGCWPEIETAESFEGKNKILEGEKAKKVASKQEPVIGIELMASDD